MDPETRGGVEKELFAVDYMNVTVDQECVSITALDVVLLSMPSAMDKGTSFPHTHPHVAAHAWFAVVVL